MKFRLPKNRFVRIVLLLSLGSFLFLAGILIYRQKIARDSARELEEMIAQLDREDPGWSWEELLKKRNELPDDQNSYTLIKKISEIPPSPNSSFEPPLSSWRILPEGLPPEVAEWGAQLVADTKERILLSRQLANRPRGVHFIQYSEDVFNADFNSLQKVRTIAFELLWDMRVHAQLHHFDVCVQDIRAIRNAARSCGEEGLIPFLIRIALETIACSAVQQMLSQGEIKSTDLEILQKEFLEEAHEPTLKKALRSERAAALKSMQYRASSYGLILQSIAISIRGDGTAAKGQPIRNLAGVLLALKYPPFAAADQAYMLRRMTDIINVLDKSEREIKEFLDQFEQENLQNRTSIPPASQVLTNLYLPPINKLVFSNYRAQGWLRSTVCGLAAERFRIVNKRWPNNLEELVPNFLEKVEEDPYTGKPLLFKRLNDGIVIYSVGQDLKDDGGDVLGVVTDQSERGAYKSNLPTDIGFRLWDVDKRGKTNPTETQKR
ncbi:hypothetical protein KIH39_24850 [Telmatocola sphagniphila]|uniref:Uncharacterized protein n=1 Tax=Telmatocola sphagniphila TaxID=1123043 RepID=A0A8E6B5A3_9BACT|nr:hypothetical protein [Telmatocola sphagniphila]QVL32026.1 hypothetical protein KIH39_24850 [Telmatocola sphagniphila]